jgi:hypothetical protein
MTKAQQSKERMTMKENHKQIYNLCTSKYQRFKVETALNTEREDMTERHITEMERFEDTDDNSRQGILSKRSIKTLKKKEVRNQHISELRALKTQKKTQKYTWMTSEEQRKTIKIFTTEQRIRKEQLYNKISRETAWQTTLAKTTRPYANRHEMTRHYEIQRKRKRQFQRNNNLPVTHMHTSHPYEHSNMRRKKKRQDEQQ